MSCSNCNNKNCNNSTLCGCKDTYLTSPLPCPTPVACPAAQPCGETFNSQCIIYTADTYLCDQDEVVMQGDSVETSLQKIVDYFCTRLTNIPVYVVEAGDNIDVTETTVGVTTTYTVSYTGAVKFVKEFTSSLDGSPVTILGTELAACGIITSACNGGASRSDYVYGISYLDAGTWHNITNVSTVEVSVVDSTGDMTIILAVPSSGDPMTVRITIIG